HSAVAVNDFVIEAMRNGRSAAPASSVRPSTCSAAAATIPSSFRKETTGSLPYPRPNLGSTCSSFTRAGIRETTIQGGTHGPHQGSQAGPDHEARPQRDRYGLAGGADRDAHRADQPAHRAPADAQARPL